MLIPLFLLGLAELSLRWLGYGHPVSFLVPKQIGGTAMLVDNPWFGLSFFPPALARSPSPVTIPAEKPPGTFRIFLFGESAALGDPRPAYGMGRYLEALLTQRFPGTKFEVVCVAMTAINSHAILPIARECTRYQGDLWIVYMGNNEFAGPFGANTVFGPRAPPAWAVRCFLAVQSTRTGQFLVSLARKLHPSSSAPAAWGGLKMFLDHQLPPEDARRERVYRNFALNLDAIIHAGVRARVPILLSTVASNLKDCPPFSSATPKEGTGAAPAGWRKWSESAAANRAQGNFVQALDGYSKALALGSNCAQTHFDLGECYLALTNLGAARQHFSQARDLDTLPFRADTRLNALIASAARRYAGRGVWSVDAERALGPLSASGIPGWEAFYEHVHLNWDGNYRMGLAFAQTVLPLLPAQITNRETASWADAQDCARRLGLTDWNRYAVFEEILRRLSEPPFTGQPNHDVQLERITNALAEIRARVHPGAAQEARALFESELRQHPQDHWLHHNYAEFLTRVGDLAGATRQLEAVRDLLPAHYTSDLQLGRLLAAQKQYDQAADRLREAAQLRPDLFDVHVELGHVLVAAGKLAQGLKEYAQAWNCSGRDEARLHFLQADALSRQQHRDAAIQNLRQAIDLRHDYWEAHELLGMELALDTQYPQAQAEFEQVVQFHPNYAEGHLNLGIALARQHRLPEALDQFRQTLQLDPHNARAQEFLSTLSRLQTQSAAP